MKKFLIIALFFAFCFGGDIKIATFNTENLFDDKNNGNEYSDFRIGKSPWNSVKYAKKLSSVSEVIKSVNADIIALQEIENVFVLRELASQSGYKYFEFAKPASAPFGVGIMSKIPIKNHQIYTIANVKTRDILRADFNVDNVDFSVFVVHFLSMKNSLDKKRKEINTLQTIAKMPENAVLLGDFNTDYGYNSLLNSFINSSDFIDLWAYTDESKSHISGRRIDHILTNDKNLKFKKGSFGVYQKSREVSDHYPIFATFSTNSQNFTPKATKIPQNTTTKATNIADIKKSNSLNSQINLQNVAVTFTDKNGYAIADKDKNGIYVFDKNHDVTTGDLIDINAFEYKIYKGNPELIKAQILAKHGRVDLSKYCKSASEISRASSGDIICEISGVMKNGYLSGNFGKIRVFSHSGRLPNGKMSFKNAFMQNYNNERELIVK